MPKRAQDADATDAGLPKLPKQRHQRAPQPGRLPPDARAAAARRQEAPDDEDVSPRQSGQRSSGQQWKERKERERSAWDATREARVACVEAAAPAAAQLQEQRQRDNSRLLQKAVDAATRLHLQHHTSTCSKAAEGGIQLHASRDVLCHTVSGPVRLAVPCHHCACGAALQAEAYEADCVPTAPVLASTWVDGSLLRFMKPLMQLSGVSADGACMRRCGATGCTALLVPFNATPPSPLCMRAALATGLKYAYKKSSGAQAEIVRPEHLTAAVMEHSKVLSLAVSSLPRMQLACLDSDDPALYCPVCAHVHNRPTMEDGG